MTWIDHDDYLDSRAQHEAEREEWEAQRRPEPAPPEPDHDLGRCDCETCDEDRAEAGWVRNRNHR